MGIAGNHLASRTRGGRAGCGESDAREEKGEKKRNSTDISQLRYDILGLVGVLKAVSCAPIINILVGVVGLVVIVVVEVFYPPAMVAARTQQQRFRGTLGSLPPLARVDIAVLVVLKRHADMVFAPGGRRWPLMIRAAVGVCVGIVRGESATAKEGLCTAYRPSSPYLRGRSHDARGSIHNGGRSSSRGAVEGVVGQRCLDAGSGRARGAPEVAVLRRVRILVQGDGGHGLRRWASAWPPSRAIHHGVGRSHVHR